MTRKELTKTLSDLTRDIGEQWLTILDDAGISRKQALLMLGSALISQGVAALGTVYRDDGNDIPNSNDLTKRVMELITTTFDWELDFTPVEE